MVPPPQRVQFGGENDNPYSSQFRKARNRQKRYYGTQAGRYLASSSGNNWKRPKPFTTTTTTTTDRSKESGAEDWEEPEESPDGDYEGGYGGRPGGNSGSNNYGQDGAGGGHGPGGNNPITTRRPIITTSTKSSVGTKEPISSPSRGDRPSNPSNSQGSSGRKSGQMGRRTEVTSAFVGWPEPECGKDRFNMFIGINTRIIAETLRGRVSGNNLRNGKSKHCTVRWNQSDIPYQTIVTEGDWWCNAEFYTTFAQAVFFLGAIVGGFLIGWIADT